MDQLSGLQLHEILAVLFAFVSLFLVLAGGLIGLSLRTKVKSIFVIGPGVLGFFLGAVAGLLMTMGDPFPLTPLVDYAFKATGWAVVIGALVALLGLLLLWLRRRDGYTD